MPELPFLPPIEVDPEFSRRLADADIYVAFILIKPDGRRYVMTYDQAARDEALAKTRAIQAEAQA